MTAYVGIDLCRRRSLVVCIDGEGERRWWRRIDNSPLALAEVIGEAGSGSGGGDRGHLRLVLGDRRSHPSWWAGASGASVRGEGVR